MAKNNIWSKIGKFLKTTFFGGGWHWDKENGWQSISDFVSENPSEAPFSDSFGGSSSSVSHGAFGSLINKYTGGGLTDAENAQNAFNAHEAALQREWSAQEAERARDWQEEMYAKYNSLSGKIAQAEQAGVNPMLAVTGNAVSPMSPSAPTPSGASASSGGFAHQSFTDLIGMVLGLVKAKSEIQLTESQTNLNNAEALKTGKETSWIDQLSKAQLDNLVASKDELESRLGVNSATANKLQAEFDKLNQECARISQITSVEKRKIEAEALLLEWQNANKSWMYGVDVGLKTVGEINQLLSTFVSYKTGVSLSDKPLVVPKGGSVVRPSDIVN